MHSILRTLAKWTKPERRPPKLSGERRAELVMESVLETERQVLGLRAKYRAKLAAGTLTEQDRAKLEQLDALVAAMGLESDTSTHITMTEEDDAELEQLLGLKSDTDT
jgi:hypothetical protein